MLRLRQDGINCSCTRVETEEAFLAALRGQAHDIILSDFSLPQFDGMSALAIAARESPDVPFIFVSGTIGEERALDALRCGAVDYILKSNLKRLAPAVIRDAGIPRVTYSDPEIASVGLTEAQAREQVGDDAVETLVYGD